MNCFGERSSSPGDAVRKFTSELSSSAKQNAAVHTPKQPRALRYRVAPGKGGLCRLLGTSGCAIQRCENLLDCTFYGLSFRMGMKLRGRVFA